MTARKRARNEEIQESVSLVVDNLISELECKGRGCFASNHEIYGVILEEVDEYLDAIHDNLTDSEMINELSDIAVAAIFGITSIKMKATNW
jgi:hypothetical protein